MKCPAELYIFDDHGDNHATIKCQLEKGHAGMHTEVFWHTGHEIVVQWEQDERGMLDSKDG